MLLYVRIGRIVPVRTSESEIKSEEYRMDVLVKNSPTIPAIQNNYSQMSRIEWVDVAKGIGLILVIFGHLLYSGTWTNVHRAIYSFHMPMYFVLSGFIAHPRKTTFDSYVKQKSQELLLPSVIFIAMTLPIYLYVNREYFETFWYLIPSIVFLNGRVAFNDPVWFFLVMFQVLVLFDALRVICYSVTKKALAALASFLVGWGIYIFSVPLPFGIEKTIVCMGFYIAGSMLKDVPHVFLGVRKWFAVALMFAVWVLSGVVFNEKVSLYGFDLGHYWLFIISGLSGSMVWFGICYLLRRIRLFQVWGRNTMVVVGTHYVGVSVFRALASKIHISQTFLYDPLALIVSVFAMFCYMPICAVVNQHLPVLAGKQRAAPEK